MSWDWRYVGQVIITLSVIMDPPGAVPVFLAVTAGLQPKERPRAALMAVFTALVVITSFAIGGQQILRYLHVSVGALQTAGGLLLLLVSLELLRGANSMATVRSDQRMSIAMVPLGTPLLAGPGAIVSTMLFAQRTHGITGWAQLLLAILVVHGVLFLAMRFSDLIMKVIRPAGVLLVTRVAGMLLAAIAVQLAADGVRALSRQP